MLILAMLYGLLIFDEVPDAGWTKPISPVRIAITPKTRRTAASAGPSGFQSSPVPARRRSSSSSG